MGSPFVHEPNTIHKKKEVALKDGKVLLYIRGGEFI